ncbi:MAG: NAD(P)-dependent oxidoreductase [Lachnospiraceae bacterium]|nr:NAD(P)-dependent oxidoreductase [Lachnospiraceae bacterium]
MKIGIIGLGAMGLPIAQNLIQAGNEVKGFDVSEKRRILFAESGGLSCSLIADAVEKCQVVVTSLPNPAIVREVMLGKDGVLGKCMEGACVLDLSSVDPETSRDLSREAEKRGIDYADVPVSGGVRGAREASLTMMFGGKREVFDRVKPLLSQIGKKIIYTGSVGNGDAVKIVNNLLLGCNVAAIAEAITLGRQLGLTLDVMKEVICQSSGNSYAFEAKVDSFIGQDTYDGGFALSLARKDMNLAVKASEKKAMPLPVTTAALQVYTTAQRMGLGDKDISSVIKVWENLAGFGELS